MANKISESWSNYRPTKVIWGWSCVASVAATLILGFTVGGWVTGGSADTRVASAAEGARADLAAELCVHRFLNSPTAKADLAALKAESSWSRDTMVQKGGWVTFAAMKDPVSGAASRCAERLVTAELPKQADAGTAAKPAAN